MGPAMQIIHEACQQHAREQARLLDAEVQLWLRMGFSLSELRLVHERTGDGLGWTAQVLPVLMLDCR